MAVFDVAAIKKVLMKAKAGGEAVNYAFGLAATPEGCALVMHRTRAGRTLMQALKSEKTLKRFGFGQVTVDGKQAIFAAEKPVKGMAKQLKRRFRAEGILFRPVVPEEEPALEAAGAATAAPPGGPAATPEPEADPAIAGLEARVAALVGRAKALRDGLEAALGDAKTVPKGSVAARLRAEVTRLARAVAALARRLREEIDDPSAVGEMTAEAAALARAIEAAETELARVEREGAAWAVGTGDGAEAARALGWPDPPSPSKDGGVDYLWVTGEDGAPVLQPVDETVPPARWDAADGMFVFEIERGTKGNWNWFANNPQPNARYEYENGHTYETDENGHTEHVEATIDIDPWVRDKRRQAEFGNIGDAAYPGETYDGGHLIAREFGGSAGRLNVVPMQSYLNQQGAWRKLEQQWKAQIEAGKDVKVNIEVRYPSSGNADQLATPEEFVVTSIIDGKPGPRRRIKNTRSGK